MLGKLKDGLKKTRDGVFSRIGAVLSLHKTIDEALWNEIEEILISGDVGVDTTLKILDHLRERVRKEKASAPEEIIELLKQELVKFLSFEEKDKSFERPNVILVVGVNGTGKTTSIAKLARYYKEKGEEVLLVAADTFRAAAIEQLEIWAERIGCGLIRHQPGADPAAVVYDALQAAKSRGVDRVIIDTAGRLHTKVNLMNELNKIYRVVEKQLQNAPHEVILVIDAGNGQNAIRQACEFVKAVRVDSIFLSKLDGTAKGGVVLAIKEQLGISVKYVGLGEKAEDMALFDAREFVEGLFSKQ